MSREIPSGEQDDKAKIRNFVDPEQYAAFEASPQELDFRVSTQGFLLDELSSRLRTPSAAGLSIAATHASIALFDVLRGLEGGPQDANRALHQATGYLYPLYPESDHAVIDCVCAEAVARKLSKNT